MTKRDDLQAALDEAELRLATVEVAVVDMTADLTRLHAEVRGIRLAMEHL